MEEDPREGWDKSIQNEKQEEALLYRERFVMKNDLGYPNKKGKKKKTRL